MMWYDERIRKDRNISKSEYSIYYLNRKVLLPNLKEALELLLNLWFRNDEQSKYFQQNIRSYNMMFLFTSLDRKIETGINNGFALYIFLLHGQNYHLIENFCQRKELSLNFLNCISLTLTMKFKKGLILLGMTLWFITKLIYYFK